MSNKHKNQAYAVIYKNGKYAFAETWPECQALISANPSKARFKGFPSRSMAEDWVREMLDIPYSAPVKDGSTKPLNKEEFLQYCSDNFNMDVFNFAFVDNILCYVRNLPKEQHKDALLALLSGTIGLEEDEILRISL